MRGNWVTDKTIFGEILKKLEGLNYYFISGLAVAIYTKGKRIPGDIDMVIIKNDIDIFANRLGVAPHKRRIDKGTFMVDDFGFETNYKGQMIECSTGFPPKRMEEGTSQKIFEHKVKSSYLGQTVFVEPLEELVNQKAFMHREKDMADLELLKDKKLNKNFFLEICQDKDNFDEVWPVVISAKMVLL